MVDPLHTFTEAAKSVGDSRSSRALSESTMNNPPVSEGMKFPLTPDINIPLCEPHRNLEKALVPLCTTRLSKHCWALKKFWEFQLQSRFSPYTTTVPNSTIPKLCGYHNPRCNHPKPQRRSHHHKPPISLSISSFSIIHRKMQALQDGAEPSHSPLDHDTTDGSSAEHATHFDFFSSKYAQERHVWYTKRLVHTPKGFHDQSIATFPSIENGIARMTGSPSMPEALNSEADSTTTISESDPLSKPMGLEDPNRKWVNRC
ncbi:hypothetical protein L6452_01838 [Arctium lappa]|uniref:Uncharacterized protein n=1 Tax=Arctium lappa TaxID=4217 RepID=A0ACB9FJ92_ARCLA|nr:hypothetical protein L6452_01838 [Arctium lappa]